MQLTAADVLRAFRQDELQLFIAAASITVGLVSIGFSFIRRRFDRSLSFFAWFAVLYGIRLWMQSAIHGLMTQPSPFLIQVQFALNFFVSIPALLFFEASGFINRAGRLTVYTICVVETGLIAAIFLGAPFHLLDMANSVAIIVGSLAVLILAWKPLAKESAAVFRTGLVIFLAFVLWTNGAELAGHRTSVELYGFTAFLACLGYIAAKNTLDRDQQLNSIQQELEIARRIQMSIVPHQFPTLENVTLAARYLPMTAVAGDFYDLVAAGNDGLGLLIADVSGHGVPAALIASMVKVAVQSQRDCAQHPERLLTGVNEVLCGNAQSHLVTAAYLHLDLAHGEFRYGAAGHPPMFLLREGKVLQITENGLVLALMPAAVYTATTQPLLPGDRLLLYTDGLIEATNAAGEEFGEQRLSDLLLSSRSRSAEEAADQILNAVTGWASTQTDDLTLLVCDYRQNP